MALILALSFFRSTLRLLWPPSSAAFSFRLTTNRPQADQPRTTRQLLTKGGGAGSRAVPARAVASGLPRLEALAPPLVRRRTTVVPHREKVQQKRRTETRAYMISGAGSDRYSRAEILVPITRRRTTHQH
ncbi:hypothetical protein L596_030043 [Steinernema carpocapsae]|uniref:Secreted protein n=1 Tax=Steinernema carpocapsae TaxID=34508 RepID=A0A4U5LRK3_STECR|nr:hypothetical protein L596_030043 [Steinernema carpocapsae]